VRRRRGQAFAVRGLLWERAGFGRLLAEVGLTSLAREALGAPARAVDATLFDKIPEANWRVAPHQDVIVPVERAAAELASVVRAGVRYVEPPASLLRSLIAARVHLDDCPADNGALAVVPGSHRQGRLDDEALDGVSAADFVVCEARAGDVLLMSPLVVHRSSVSREPRHRRVLQVLYARDEPLVQLDWKSCA
jgi:ectoine hydroxylase-related dioxygenase (phytanoyl-CoA dioxygenase family)